MQVRMEKLRDISVSPNYYAIRWLMEYANFIRFKWRHI
jgi:hypothetical protein